VAAAKLRDFLYLDVDRVRSLLAQLERGVVEQVVERLKQSKEGRAGASLFQIFDLGGTLVREKASEQTKTLQDALYLLFEEAASETGLFDSSPSLADEASWLEGTTHRSLREGELIKLTAPTRILDSKHFHERVKRFAEWPRLIASFAAQDQLATIKNPKQRERKLEELAAASLGGPVTLDLIRDIGQFTELFMGGQIVMRQFPCGEAKPDFALVGTLLDRPGFLQEEREALFAKYGAAPASWTVVSQVATIPKPGEGSEELELGDLFDDEADRISRTQFEDMAVQLMRLFETVGIAEGPVYPSIAVTPIAVFREVAVRQ
jgi:hypothetical protein